MNVATDFDLEFMGGLWYLNEINNFNLHKIEETIKQFEWANEVGRVYGSHIKSAKTKEEAHFYTEGDKEMFRFTDCHFEDTIHRAAKELISSYRDLPKTLSTIGPIYRIFENTIISDYVWTIAKFSETSDEFLAIDIFPNQIEVKSGQSYIKYKSKLNQQIECYYTYANVVLIDGKDKLKHYLTNKNEENF